MARIVHGKVHGAVHESEFCAALRVEGFEKMISGTIIPKQFPAHI